MKFNNLLFLYGLILILVGQQSCDLINPSETIPATIELQEIEFNIPPQQGTSRQKITEVWVYADANFVGAFDPPTSFPFITDSEESHFVFRPGIRNNGILDDAIVYPMMDGYELDINTTPGTLTSVTPVFQYKSNVVFSLIADFETINDFMDNRDKNPESMIIRSGDDPYEGNFSGKMVMTETADSLEVGHAIALNLPTDGRSVYLEIHYRSELEMAIGLLGIPLSGQSFSNFFYVVKPSDEWNKIYLELTDYLTASGLPAYKILIKCLYPHGATVPSFTNEIDNIKVLHL